MALECQPRTDVSLAALDIEGNMKRCIVNGHEMVSCNMAVYFLKWGQEASSKEHCYICLSTHMAAPLRRSAADLVSLAARDIESGVLQTHK